MQMHDEHFRSKSSPLKQQDNGVSGGFAMGSSGMGFSTFQRNGDKSWLQVDDHLLTAHAMQIIDRTRFAAELDPAT
jgi:hypothetical protein